MKHKTIVQIFILLLFITHSFNLAAQKAVLYNFDFRVPDAIRHEIQVYDENGNKKYIKDNYDKTVLDKYLEPVSDEEVHAICDLAAEMFKRKYGYTEINMIYPTMGGSQSDKLTGFPNKGFKNTVKKNAVDAFISMELKIENKGIVKNNSLYWEENGTERTLFMNISLSYTIFNAQEGIIDQKEISLKEELDELFSENYNTEIDDKGYKLRKLYLTKEEIIDIYKMAEKKLEASE